MRIGKLISSIVIGGKVILPIIVVAGYVAYHWMYINNIKMADELYFITSTIGLFLFPFLCIRRKDLFIVKPLLIATGMFFASVLYLYLKRWVFEGEPSTNYYTAATASVVITFSYLIVYGIIRIIALYRGNSEHCKL